MSPEQIRSRKKPSQCQPQKQALKNIEVEGEQADLRLSALAKALGHPVRVEIIRILSRKQECVCGEIVDQLSLPQSTVSQHLKVLKDVGLICGEIEGVKTCYCINNTILRELKILIAGI